MAAMFPLLLRRSRERGLPLRRSEGCPACAQQPLRLPPAARVSPPLKRATVAWKKGRALFLGAASVCLWPCARALGPSLLPCVLPFKRAAAAESRPRAPSLFSSPHQTVFPPKTSLFNPP